MIIMTYIYKRKKKSSFGLIGYATKSGKFVERKVTMNWDYTYIDSNDDEFENSRAEYIAIYAQNGIVRPANFEESAARSAAIYYAQMRPRTDYRIR